MSYRA